MKSIAERKLMITSNHNELSIAKQCDLLAVSRSSLYYVAISEQCRKPSYHPHFRRAVFPYTVLWGRKTITLLALKGYFINRKPLRRLMALHGWQTIYQAPCTTIIDVAKYKYQYLLKGISIAQSEAVSQLP